MALVAERNTPVRLAFRGGEVVLEAGSGDEAQAVEVLAVDFEGDDINIAFNPQFLLDGLGAIGSDVARLPMTTSTKPAILTGASLWTTGGSRLPLPDHADPPVRLICTTLQGMAPWRCRGGAALTADEADRHAQEGTWTPAGE